MERQGQNGLGATEQLFPLRGHSPFEKNFHSVPPAWIPHGFDLNLLCYSVFLHAHSLSRRRWAVWPKEVMWAASKYHISINHLQALKIVLLRVSPAWDIASVFRLLL